MLISQGVLIAVDSLLAIGGNITVHEIGHAEVAKHLDYYNIAFNVGAGYGYSVLEMIKNYEITNKVKINYEYGPRRDGDIEQIFSNNKKVKEILKWKPTRSLANSMHDVYNWQKNKLC